MSREGGEGGREGVSREEGEGRECRGKKEGGGGGGGGRDTRENQMYSQLITPLHNYGFIMGRYIQGVQTIPLFPTPPYKESSHPCGHHVCHDICDVLLQSLFDEEKQQHPHQAH